MTGRVRRNRREPVIICGSSPAVQAQRAVLPGRLLVLICDTED
jgi:hypothetical protein